MKRAPVLAILACSVLAAAGARGDIVTLTDGSTLNGTLHKTDDGWTVTAPDGHVTAITADRVSSIQVTSSKSNSDVAADRLHSLRNSVVNLNDLAEIISRYQAFIARYQDTPAAADAMSDLQVWQERQSKGEVKLGKNWILPQDRAAIVAKSLAGAVEARTLMGQGRMADADSVLTQALADNPGNITALYLRGLIFYDNGKMPEARQCFEAVLAVVQANGPTLNNLAVIMFRQKQIGGAMTMYDRAMTALPLSKDILDNVAEAFHALPDNEKDSIPATRCARRFAEQDTKLQAILAASGWYRWGSTWINQSQYNAVQAADAQIKQQIADLQKRFDGLSDQINQVDLSIAANNRSLRQIEANSWGHDINGNAIQLPYPQSYYDIQQDNKTLATQRQQLATQQDGLRQQAKQVQQSEPIPKFTGIQQVMGPASAPIQTPDALPGDAPSNTAPMTAPPDKATSPGSPPAQSPPTTAPTNPQPPSVASPPAPNPQSPPGGPMLPADPTSPAAGPTPPAAGPTPPTAGPTPPSQ